MGTGRLPEELELVWTGGARHGAHRTRVPSSHTLSYSPLTKAHNT